MNKPVLLAASLLATLAACDPDVGPGRWDNPLDPEGSNYHPPTVSLKDTSLRQASGGKILAHATSRNSTIASVRWIRNDTLLANTDTILSTDGWKDGCYRLSAQAVDAMGLAGQAVQITVWIGNRLPELHASYSPVASSHAATVVSLSASDPDGSIASIAWDTVPDRYAFLTSRFPLAGAAGSSRTVYWKAVDNDGAATIESFSVLFAAPPAVRIAPDLENSSIGTSFGSGASWTVYLTSTVLPLLVGAGIPGIPSASLEVVVKEGANTYPCVASSRAFPGGPIVQDEQRFACSLDAPGTNPRSLVAQVVSPYGDTTRTSLLVTIQR